MNQQQVQMWSVAKLTPNPLNPRGAFSDDEVADLAASIREQGILQPLTITPDGRIIIGHRRFAAARLAGLGIVPVIVRDCDEREQVEIMLVENIQRASLTPLEEARGYARLIDTGLRQSDVARRTGQHSSRVQMCLTILKLDPEAQLIFNLLTTPVTAAPHLAALGDPVKQRRYAGMIAAGKLSIRRLAELTRPTTRQPKPEAKQNNGNEATGHTDKRVDRATAVRLLSTQLDKAIAVRELQRVLDRVCCACGIDSFPKGAIDICKSCPLPEFVKAIAEHTGCENTEGNLSTGPGSA